MVRSARSECFQVILKQLHGQPGVSGPTPPIALNAADEPLPYTRRQLFDQTAPCSLPYLANHPAYPKFGGWQHPDQSAPKHPYLGPRAEGYQARS